ncbi:MAG: DUF1641 domain-containing protein [Firmicutes bacterium]|nr:DUF1641 domain-containing protein [Bacillota bacterium]
MVDNIMEEEEVMLSDKAVAIVNQDLVSFVETLKDLVGQLEPQLKKLSKEVSPALNKLKTSVDKEETLVLLNKLTANTGTLLELISYLEALTDLKNQLEPQLKSIVKEVQPVTNALKSNLDKDETILLIERMSSNTGTLLELVSYLEALTDLKNQLEPQLKGIMKEVSPVLNKIKTNIDADETLVLLERLTANTGTLLELVSLMEAFNDLRNQLEPQLKGMAKEVSPVLNKIKANIDKDETLLLLEKLTSSMGTMIELMSYMEALTDLKNQLEPQLKKMMAEISPAVTALRTFAEDEKTVKMAVGMFNTLKDFAADEELQSVIARANSLKGPITQFMGCMCSRVSEDGEDDTTTAEASLNSLMKLTQIASTPLAQNMVNTIATTMKETTDADIKPVSPVKMLSAFRDPDVQRATGFLIHFLKKLGQGLKA